MKRIGCKPAGIVLLLVLLLCIPRNVQAGDINAQEQMLLDMMHESIEYKGVVYVAAPGYIEEATAYFLQDDMDLTEEQAEEAIETVFANVETGIADGYLVPFSERQPEADNSQGDGTVGTVTDETVTESGEVPEGTDMDSEQPDKPVVGIIKNTGHDLSGVRMMGCLMVIMLLFCMGCIRRFGLLVDYDES